MSVNERYHGGPGKSEEIIRSSGMFECSSMVAFEADVSTKQHRAAA